ncbi:hypothetical protein Newbould305_0905 [Staphylococcus aureus subsp. aureus str. Newbould 305]|nr:hypothetical protein Newbould305_0905 [Staphylococcus aureus subsp. aureus str. Newbould 305]
MRLFDNYICQIYTKKYDCPPMYDILKQHLNAYKS